MAERQQKRDIRHKRVRAKIKGTEKRPRLCVFRTPKHIYAQLIDDEKGKTILSISDAKITKKESKVSLAHEVGKLIAEKAVEKKITQVVFDRGGYKYHGRIKALADGARKGGLKF